MPIEINLIIGFTIFFIIIITGYYIVKLKSLNLILTIKEQKDNLVVLELKNNSQVNIKDVEIFIDDEYIDYIENLKINNKKEIKINSSECNEYKILKKVRDSLIFKKYFIKLPLRDHIILKSTQTNIKNISTNLLIQSYISMLKKDNEKMIFEKIIDIVISQITAVVVTLITISIPLSIYFDSIDAYTKEFLKYTDKMINLIILMPLLIGLLIFIFNYNIKMKKEKIYDCDMRKEIREKRNIRNEIKRRYNINDDEFNEYIEKFK